MGTKHFAYGTTDTACTVNGYLHRTHPFLYTT
jgi:hypothetical protein